MLQEAVLTLLDQIPEARATVSRDGDGFTVVASLMWGNRPLAAMQQLERSDLAHTDEERARGKSLGLRLADMLERAKHPSRTLKL